MKVKILGKVIGTASGWDQVTDDGVQFYDYKGSIKELDGCDNFYFDWVTGKVELYDDEGEVLATYDYKIFEQ